jgi:hypothetical protein
MEGFLHTNENIQPRATVSPLPPVVVPAYLAALRRAKPSLKGPGFEPWLGRRFPASSPGAPPLSEHHVSCQNKPVGPGTAEAKPSAGETPATKPKHKLRPRPLHCGSAPTPAGRGARGRRHDPQPRAAQWLAPARRDVNSQPSDPGSATPRHPRLEVQQGDRSGDKRSNLRAPGTAVSGRRRPSGCRLERCPSSRAGLSPQSPRPLPGVGYVPGPARTQEKGGVTPGLACVGFSSQSTAQPQKLCLPQLPAPPLSPHSTVPPNPVSLPLPPSRN